MSSLQPYSAALGYFKNVTGKVSCGPAPGSSQTWLVQAIYAFCNNPAGPTPAYAELFVSTILTDEGGGSYAPPSLLQVNLTIGAWDVAVFGAILANHPREIVLPGAPEVIHLHSQQNNPDAFPWVVQIEPLKIVLYDNG